MTTTEMQTSTATASQSWAQGQELHQHVLFPELLETTSLPVQVLPERAQQLTLPSILSELWTAHTK